MAVSRHLGYYHTANSTIRSTDPENPCQEPDMEWIGCTVREIFAFKLHCDLETAVRGHSRSSKVTLFDRARTTLYSSSIVTMPLSSTLSQTWPHIGRKLLVFATPLYLAPPVGGEAVGFAQRPLVTKNRMMGLSDGGRISMIRSAVLIQYTRVTDRQTDRYRQTDGQTDGIGVAYTRYSIYAVARKKVKEVLPSHSYGTSLAIWDYIVLPATRHK